MSADLLERAFPSAPAILPRYVLRFRNLSTGRMYLTNTVACYAARKIVDLASAGAGVFSKKLTVTAPASPWVRWGEAGFLELSSDRLVEILDYEYSELERDWQLPPNMAATILAFSRPETGETDAEKEGTTARAASSSRSSPTSDSKVVRANEETTTKAAPVAPAKTFRAGSVDDLGDRVTAETVRAGVFDRDAMKKIALKNGVWKDSYDRLSNGLMRMTVAGNLRSIVKKGGNVIW